MNRIFNITLALALFCTGIIVPGHCLAVTFTVDSTLDEVDDNLSDCICRTAANTCTLRAAIQEANACAGDDTINLPSGNYVLSLAGAGEDAAATGDLDITGNLTITGTGTTRPVIDAKRIDRIFSCHRPDQHIHDLSDNTKRGRWRSNQSHPGFGGGIRNEGTFDTPSGEHFKQPGQQRSGQLS